MTGRHRWQDEPSVRLVHAQDETEQARALEGTDAENWTIRPKMRQPDGEDISAPKPAWRRDDHPVFISSLPLATAGKLDDEGRTRRFLALGLAGMIYVIGIAGLWSMVQTFDQTTSPPLTPAGDQKAMPPLERAIDLRDAQLEADPRAPAIAPAPSSDADGDIATSDLQKQS